MSMKVTIPLGSKRPIRATATLPGGTLTISGTPKVSIYDVAGAVDSNFDNIDATGWSLSALEEIEVVHAVDTDDLAAGDWTAKFTFAATGSDTIPREYVVEIPFAIQASPSPYSRIYSIIRQRLQDSVIGIEDSEFDQEIEAVIDELLAAYPDETYSGLDATDHKWMDRAVGRLVAVRLQGPFSTGGSVMPLILEKNANSTRQFAMPSSGADTLDERKRWEREAKFAFTQVSFAAAVRTARPPSVVSVAGRRRSQARDVENFLEMNWGIEDAAV